MKRLLPIGLLAVVLALTLAGPSLGTVRAGNRYFVSTSGSDANDGRTPQTPWRTLVKVASADLQAGDSVLLRGGETFAGPLKTPSSGAEGAPILFASYGTGRARIVGLSGAAAIYLNSNSFLHFSDLDISAPSANCVLTSSGGPGSSDVVLDGVAIHDCGNAGLNADNPADARITLTHSTIEGTQGCGVFFRGASFDITDNNIVNTGINASGALSYPLHGVYAKGPAPVITDNTIRDFQTAAVTIRSTGSDVERNTIDARTRGLRGISYYEETGVPGTTRIIGNRITRVSVQGVAIDNGSTTAAFGGGATTASTSENFVVTGNDVTMRGHAARHVIEGIRLLRVPNAVVIGNRVGGNPTRALTVYEPSGTYLERSNVWQARVATPSFSWNGTTMRFAGYAARSGQGARDLLFH